MTLCDLKGVGEVGPVPRRGILRRVPQPQELRRVVPVRLLLLDRPASWRALAPRPPQHVAPQRRLFRSWLRRPDLFLELGPLWLSHVVEAVAVDAPAAVVGLGRRLALAILILQPEEEGLAGLCAVVAWAKEVAFPGVPAIGAAALVHARVQAPLQLREDVGVMQRLEACQLLFRLALRRGPATAPPRLRHLVEDPEVVGEAGLPGRHRLEDLRVSTLSLEVDERCVPRLEVQRRERLALQDKPEGDVLARVLAPADATPQTQIIDELEQFEVLRVAGNGAQDLLHEGLLDALASAILAAFFLLRAAVVRGQAQLLRAWPADLLGWVGRVAAPLAPDVAGTDGRLAHLFRPVEVGPQSVLQAGRLQKLQGPLAPLLCHLLALPPKEVAVLLREVAVGRLLGSHQKFVGSSCSPPLIPRKLTDLLRDALGCPGQPDHGTVDPVAVRRASVGARVNVQRPKRLNRIFGERSQRLRDVLELWDGDLAVLAGLAGPRGNLWLGHPAAVDRLQAPRLQGAAVLADAPRPKLCPELHEAALLRAGRRRQPCVVVRNVLGRRCLDVVGLKELLLNTLAVGLDSLLVLLGLLARRQARVEADAGHCMIGLF